MADNDIGGAVSDQLAKMQSTFKAVRMLAHKLTHALIMRNAINTCCTRQKIKYFTRSVAVKRHKRPICIHIGLLK